MEPQSVTIQRKLDRKKTNKKSKINRKKANARMDADGLGGMRKPPISPRISAIFSLQVKPFFVMGIFSTQWVGDPRAL